MLRITPAHAIGIAAFVYEGVVIHMQQKKIDRLRQDNQTLGLVIGFQASQVDYLSNLLDQHGVEVTEFDKIALSNPDLNIMK